MLNLDLISTANYTHVGIEDGKVVSYILGCLFVILATCPCVPVMRMCAFMWRYKTEFNFWEFCEVQGCSWVNSVEQPVLCPWDGSQGDTNKAAPRVWTPCARIYPQGWGTCPPQRRCFNITKAKYLPANIDSESGKDIDGSCVYSGRTVALYREPYFLLRGDLFISVCVRRAYVKLSFW